MDIFQIRSRQELYLENFALRQQIAVLKRNRRRVRLTFFERLFWVIFSRFWKHWRTALAIVQPETVVRWHQGGFRLYWKWLSRRRKKIGRPVMVREIRECVRRMAYENQTWGAPRIHGELLKLGYRVSERTVSRYVKILRPNDPLLKNWKTFLLNHRDVIGAIDLFTVPTVTFRLLYGLAILGHGKRNVLHFNVTSHPNSEWVVQQIREAFPYESTIKYIIMDRDTIFSRQVSMNLKSSGIGVIRTSFRSPWQNGVMERWIGSCRRELLDHVIVFNEAQARRLIGDYVAYYNDDRTHLSLGKDSPNGRPAETKGCRLISMPRLGGLHHRYGWE